MSPAMAGRLGRLEMRTMTKKSDHPPEITVNSSELIELIEVFERELEKVYRHLGEIEIYFDAFKQGREEPRLQPPGGGSGLTGSCFGSTKAAPLDVPNQSVPSWALRQAG